MATIDRSALRIAGLYALFGVVWIIFSDDLMLAVSPDIKILAQLGTWKGLAFVLVTASVLYLVVGRRPVVGTEAAGQVEATRGVWPLIVVFILLASLIVSVGLLGVAYHMAHHKAGMFRQLEAVADLKVGQLQAWLDERMGDAEVISGATVFTELLGRQGALADPTARRKIVERLEDYIRAYGYRAVLLVDAGGGVQLAAGDASGEVGLTLKATIRRAIDSGQAMFTDLYRVEGGLGNEVAMDFIAPLSGQSGPALAVVLRVDPRRYLYPLMQTWPAPSTSAETLLFRPDGDHVLFLNDLRHRTDTALRLRLPVSEREVLAVKVLNGEIKANGEVEGIDYRKEAVIGVAKAIPRTHWHLIAKVDKTELYAQGTREAGWIILADTLVLVIAAAASILMQQRREMRLALLRQRDQEERLRNLQLLDAIAEGTTDPIFAKDVEGRYLFLNRDAARLIGRGRDTVLGQYDQALFPPEVARTIREQDNKVMASGRVETYEASYPLVAGERTFLMSKGPLRDQDGKVTGVFGVARDITERKLAEQEIIQFNAILEERVRERTTQVLAANKELETFAYSVSHDLKAPLRGIDGFSRLLQDECGQALNQDCRQFIDNIRAGTEQMTRLIDDLLAYSRMERRALQDYPVGLAEAVGSVLVEREEEIGARGVRLQVDLPPGPVRADPDGVLFVFRNLLDNALKFTRDAQPPSIEIGGRVEGEGAAAHTVIWVKDNGIGFNMKFHDRIFEIFQRLQGAEDYPGTGIGLAIVAKAMQRMKGRVWAEGEPGRGATFYLEFPSS